MRKLLLSVASALCIASTGSAFADALPVYGDAGQVAATQVFTAQSTGTVTGYFVQGGAQSGGGELYTDFFELIDVTSGVSSGFLFNSQTTSTGDSAVLASVTAGDVLIFEIFVQNLNQTFSSDPSRSLDGDNHAYGAVYGGGVDNNVTLPAGVYVGMEDTDVLTNDHAPNLDYKDISVIVTNVDVASPVPEPSSLVLLGTGVLGIAGTLRRRFTR